MTEVLSPHPQLRRILHKDHDEVVRNHALLSVKLTEMVCDFFQRLAQAEEAYIQQLLATLKQFRRRTTELKKDRGWYPSAFALWDELLDSVEKNANDSASYSNEMSQLIAQPLSEMAHKKKAQIKKVFHQKEQMTRELDKAEDVANKNYKDYQEKWTKFTAPEDQSLLKGSQILQCYNAHNSYLFSIQAYNSRCETFFNSSLPEMMDDVQDISKEVITGLSSAVTRQIESNRNRTHSLQASLDTLSQFASSVDFNADVGSFVTGLVGSDEYWPTLMVYAAPEQSEKCFDDRLLVKALTQAPLIHTQQTLMDEESELKEKMEKEEKELSSLKTLQESYSSTPSYGDAVTVENQIIELKHKMRCRQLHLCVVQGKLTMYERVNVSKSVDDLADVSPRLRRGHRASLVVGTEHEWSELHYKIPVPCGYCGQLLVDIAKQGVKCKECKLTVHHKCKKNVPYCSGEKKISQGTLARPRGASVGNIMRPERGSSSPDLNSVPSAYEAPKWLVNFDENSPPVPPRRYTSASALTTIHDTPPPLPPRTVSKNAGQVAIYDERVSPPGWKSRSPPPSTTGPKKCVALFEYFASRDGDLALSPGDVVELISTAEGGWWQGKCNNETGYFPSSYAQILAADDVIMRSMYDFEAQGPEELKLFEGQIVIMKEDRRDGWMFGRSGSEQGLFPSSYVEIVKGNR